MAIEQPNLEDNIKDNIPKRHLYFFSNKCHVKCKVQKDESLLQIMILIFFYKHHVRYDIRTQDPTLRK